METAGDEQLAAVNDSERKTAAAADVADAFVHQSGSSLSSAAVSLTNTVMDSAEPFLRDEEAEEDEEEEDNDFPCPYLIGG
jgi:hypothetical protein